MAPPRKQVRAAVARHLLTAAIALTSVPLVTNILLLLAGTFQVRNPTRQGAMRIGLQSLSIVSFNGIISSDTQPPSYSVNLQFFPNAFTWSYLSSPNLNTTSGILQAGPSSSVDPYMLIQHLPPILGLPASDTACLSHPYRRPKNPEEPQCTPFWAAVHREASSPYRFQLAGIASYFLFITHLSAAIVALATLASEICIVYRPGWMRCQCWFGFLQRMCPLPKGTAEDMKTVRGHRWDKVRLWMYGLVAAYCVIPAQYGMAMGWFLVRALEDFEKRLPKGETVDATMGDGFLAAGWGGVVVSLVAVGCVGVRFLLTRENGEDGGGEERGLLADFGDQAVDGV